MAVQQNHTISNKPQFFGKLTCINNRKQKQILRDAGVEFEEHDLLTYPWTTEYLSAFLQPLSKSDWVNKSAPVIKSGEINPEQMSDNDLLAAMVANPILIRRPLIAWGDNKWVGFDWQQLHTQLPVTKADAGALVKENDDIESCAKTMAASTKAEKG